MKFETVSEFVRGVPYISEERARFLYNLILQGRFTSILELGIAHGTATCYMAAAIEELGHGKIVSVDLIDAKDKFFPSAEAQLKTTNLEQFVQIVRMQTGYTWFLHDEIKRRTINDICQPAYDLCIIDGPKNWTIDGMAFFSVDKLLKPNGMIIFDDYLWTYTEADQARDTTDGITHRSLSESERNTPQIKDIFELLVKQHPNYCNFELRFDNDWAIARKAPGQQKDYVIQYAYDYGDPLINLMVRARGKTKGLLRVAGKLLQR